MDAGYYVRLIDMNFNKGDCLKLKENGSICSIKNTNLSKMNNSKKYCFQSREFFRLLNLTSF
jgi:hypothetical protein